MKEIKETLNYDMFKKLEGNRGVDGKRINKIKKSIEEVGYITSPIIVNEKMEVIDGQGRLEALRLLKLPVEYIVDKSGIGIKECIAMNINKTNWTHKDYIKSYAERNFRSYQLLQSLIDEYPQMPLEVLATALLKIGKFATKILQNGELEITDKQYTKAVSTIKDIQKYMIYKKSISEFSTLLRSVVFCYEFEEVDTEKLFKKIEAAIASRSLIPFSSIPECMQSLEEVYNKNKRGRTKCIYLYIV